jgi:hypothetical protein
MIGTVSDEPLYSPKYRPPEPSRVPRPGEQVWSVRVNHVTWSCELRYHGEGGVEAQILRDGDFMIGRRFDTRLLAVQWAELTRNDLRDSEPTAVDARVWS